MPRITRAPKISSGFQLERVILGIADAHTSEGVPRGVSWQLAQLDSRRKPAKESMPFSTSRNPKLIAIEMIFCTPIHG